MQYEGIPFKDFFNELKLVNELYPLTTLIKL